MHQRGVDSLVQRTTRSPEQFAAACTHERQQ